MQISRVLTLTAIKVGQQCFAQTTSLLNKNCRKRKGQFCQEKNQGEVVGKDSFTSHAVETEGAGFILLV